MVALGLNRHTLKDLMQKVDEELVTITTRQHDLIIAGGAAVALLWDERRITNDIDVVSEGMTPLAKKGGERRPLRRVGAPTGLEAKVE